MSNEQNEYTFEALRETAKKIADLKEFNVVVILKTIEEYEQAGVEESFIEQQRAQLEKVYARIAELEDKARRLLEMKWSTANFKLILKSLYKQKGGFFAP